MLQQPRLPGLLELPLCSPLSPAANTKTECAVGVGCKKPTLCVLGWKIINKQIIKKILLCPKGGICFLMIAVCCPSIHIKQQTN